MHLISKEDIVGAKIKEVHSACEIYEGYHHETVYFTTDRGLTFKMPFPGFVWEATEIPENAEALPDERIEESYLVKNSWLFGRRFVRQPDEVNDLVKRMKERTIAGVFCPRMDDIECYGPDDAYLLFDDGSRAFCFSTTPQGIAPGLHYVSKTDGAADEDIAIDYFSVPTIDTQKSE